jgi:DNA-binding NarL/FixJ family response regulator
VIRVALADDQALVRAGFRVLLDAEPGFEVVGVASNGRDAVELARAQRPHVILMDIRMPEIDGIEATRQIVADPALDDVRVLILTTFELDEYIVDALRAGASGFLLKDIDPVELVRAVKVVAAGESLLSPSVTRRLISEFVVRSGTSVTPSPTLDVLTDREREVLALVGGGLSNQEIAAELFISVATARTHVSRAMTKLHARDRAQLVVAAYESRLVTPGQPGPTTGAATPSLRQHGVRGGEAGDGHPER